MGNKNMNNIYKKLHNACNTASSVKKSNKVKGMHFSPLEHDSVLRVSMDALLSNGLYPTCSYVTDINDKCVIVTCTMKINDIEAPDNFIVIDGCTAMGGLDKFGTGNAMSYARKYAFLNALNLKTGLDLEDGYNATPFKQNSAEKSVEANPQYSDDNVDVEEIKDHIKDTKTIEQFNLVRGKYKDQIQYLIKNNLRAYRQVSDIAETHSIKLNNNGQR
tara:strand:+ start:166 stop:819 length:654 start_codon:yes stop_codon:yes gene_type:complete